ncbi:MAG: hypothetical protein E6Q97_02905 [Desulfurellales bacterium]|nr:MAG: hypothetical protein E6Q97_02905 [Desulfurellales bacterium]
MIYVVLALGYVYLLWWAAELAQIRARMNEAIAYRRRQIDTSSEALQWLLRVMLRQARKEAIRRQRDAKRRYKSNPPTCMTGLAEALRYQDTLTKELP